MKYENNFCIIEYTESDLEYIEEIIKYLEYYYKVLLNFFGIEKLNNKVKIKMWDSLTNFRETFKEVYKKEADDWTCGFSYNDPNLSRIDVLSLKERRKTKGHNESTSIDLRKVIIHELVHTCHMQYCNYIYPLKYVGEGLATYLSNQYQGRVKAFKCSLEQLLTNEVVGYDNYCFFMEYIINNYSHDYVLKLASDRHFSINELPIIYSELNKLAKQL